MFPCIKVMWNSDTLAIRSTYKFNILSFEKESRLDINKFKKEMSGYIYVPLIEESLKSGINSGVERYTNFLCQW